GAGGRQVSATDATVLRRRLPVDVVARGRLGWALCVDARNRLGWVRLTPAHDAWPWRDCIPTGRARTQDLLGPPGLSGSARPGVGRAPGRTRSAGGGTDPRGWLSCS
ncbi:MAG: hypothetical protein M0010_18575, partial [Actinomycetota bacterium]|nr:hypothetical protein [Actinomycetota bacterium]